MVIEDWLEQTHCVSYFIKINLGCFMIWPVHKERTFSYLSYCVDCGYIWLLKIYLKRHISLAVLLKLIIFKNEMTSKNSYIICELIYIVHLGYIWSLKNCFKRPHCVRYFININFGCFTIIPVEKSDTAC